MMKKIKRFFLRVFYYFCLVLLRPFEATYTRFFMLLYVRLLRFYGVEFDGPPRFISTMASFDDFNLVAIGERSVISKGVTLLTHDYSPTTVYMSRVGVLNSDICRLGKISIGRNVFVGMGALVLPGVVIEDDVIIGAGSVLRGRYKSGYVYSGNPAVEFCSFDDLAPKWFSGENPLRDYRAD